MFTVARTSTLPDAIDSLAAHAAAEGFQHLDRLVREFLSLENTFSRPNEALLQACDADGNLIGIAGLSIDPFDSSGTVGRIRRMYVHPLQRRSGVGAALVQAIEARARGHFQLLRLFTDSAAAAGFYVALGYEPVRSGEASHAKSLGTGTTTPGRR